MQEIQQLCGYLNFLNRAIFPGRAFTRRMYSKFAHIINEQEDSRLKAHHHVHLDGEFRADCLVWKNFLQLKNASVVNRPMVDLSLIRSAKEIWFYSDASTNENLGF